MPPNISIRFLAVVVVITVLATGYTSVLLATWWFALFHAWHVPIFGTEVVYNWLGEQWAEGILLHASMGFCQWVGFYITRSLMGFSRPVALGWAFGTPLLLAAIYIVSWALL